MVNQLIEKLRRKMSSVFFEEIFNDVFIEDSFIVRSDGNPSAGFYVELPEKEQLSQSELLALEDNLEKAFARLPIGTVCHIQGQYFYSTNGLAALNDVASGYISTKMREYLNDRPMLKNTVVLYLIFNSSGARARNPASTFFANTRSVLKNPLRNAERNKALAHAHIQTFLTQINTIKGVSLTRMDDLALTQQRFKYFNLQFDRNHSSYSGTIENRGHEVAAGGSVLKVVFLRKTGNTLYRATQNEHGVTTFMSWVMGHFLSFPHLVNFSFRICDAEKEMKSLETSRNVRKALGSMQKQVDRMIISDIDSFTQNAREWGKTLVHLNHNVMTWDSDPERLSLQLDMIKTAYARMNGSVGLTESFNTGNYYFCYSPGMALDMFSTMLMPLDEALLHFDFSTPTRSEGKGVILSNRELEPILVDLWSEKHLVNFNRIVIGPSGSGKSFLQGALTSQELDQGTDYVILDVGGSYKNLFSLYQDRARYYEYSLDSALSFNPFLIPKDRNGLYDLTEDKVIFLLTCITIFWKDVKRGETLSKEEESVFTRVLGMYFDRVNKSGVETPRLDRFFHFFLDYAQSNPDHSDFQFLNVNSFSLVLEKFAHGSYARAVNSDDNENISDHRLSCFDLAGIQQDPILYPVVSLIIIELVLDKLLANPTKKKAIVIDEAWTMLTGTMSTFIDYLYRTIRKSRGAVIIVSQSVVELINSPVGKAIRANASTRILLDHSSQTSSIPDLQEFFALTNHEVELLRSLRNRGNWREMLLIRGSVAQVFAVDTGPHAGAAFSSWSQDRAEIARLTKQAGPEYAINQFVENKRIGG